MLRLRLLSLFLWLGPTRLVGPWWARALLALMRIIVRVALAALLVWSVFRLFPPSIPNADDYIEIVDVVNGKLDALAEPLKEFEAEPGKLRFNVVRYADGLPLQQYYRLTMSYPGEDDRVLLAVRPALAKDFPETATALARTSVWLIGSLWPIRRVDFDAGLYAGSAIVAENAGGDLTASDMDAVRRKVDPEIEKLPSAKDDALVWARRLVGPIQLLCYLLAAYGLLTVLLTRAATLWPNALIRSRDTHELDDVSADRIPGGEGDEAWWHLRLTGQHPHPEATPENDLIRSPWKGQPLRGTAETYERFYAELGRNGARVAGGRIVQPLIPLTELRRLGYMALRSARGGDTVPAFLSVEADAIQESFDAENRPVEYLIWAIPTLGFIGTVLGIGNALSATVDVESSVLSTQTEASNLVGTQIGVAFDTTFVALGLSFVLMFLFFRLQAAQERMIAFEKRTALAEIVQPENVVSARLAEDRQDAMAERMDGMAERMDGVAKQVDEMDERMAERMDNMFRMFQGLDLATSDQKYDPSLDDAIPPPAPMKPRSNRTVYIIAFVVFALALVAYFYSGHSPAEDMERFLDLLRGLGETTD